VLHLDAVVYMTRKSGTSLASPPCAPGCAARRAGHAGARRLVASVLFVLVGVTHILVPRISLTC
jgi:hypothetical protein